VAGFAAGVVGVVDTVVGVGAVVEVVLGVVGVGVGVVAGEGEGEGDTIVAGVVVVDEDVVVVADEPAAEAVFAGDGLEVSLGIPLANGSRGMLARSTLTGTVLAGPAVGCVAVCAG
jgi:hypothetical protein